MTQHADILITSAPAPSIQDLQSAPEHRCPTCQRELEWFHHGEVRAAVGGVCRVCASQVGHGPVRIVASSDVPTQRSKLYSPAWPLGLVVAAASVRLGLIDAYHKVLDTTLLTRKEFMASPPLYEEDGEDTWGASTLAWEKWGCKGKPSCCQGCDHESEGCFPDDCGIAQDHGWMATYINEDGEELSETEVWVLVKLGRI